MLNTMIVDLPNMNNREQNFTMHGDHVQSL